MFAKKVMGVLKKFEKYAHVALICLGSLMCLMILGISLYDLYERDRKLNSRLRELEYEIIRINNECVHMREVDTLILDMSEYNKYDIQSMFERYDELNIRIKRAEEDLDELYMYD